MQPRAASRMASDNWNYVGRKPRHQVADPGAVTVRLTRTGVEPPETTMVELLDFARNGVRLRLAERVGARPFVSGDAVLLQLASENSKIDFGRPATVRWQRAEGPGLWQLGCEFKDEVSLETLGELFLNEILSDGGALPSTTEP